MEKLINFLKENNIKYECDAFGLGVINIWHKARKKNIRIRKNENIIGDCKYEYSYNYSITRKEHSNFEHLTNTVIRIFME